MSTLAGNLFILKWFMLKICRKIYYKWDYFFFLTFTLQLKGHSFFLTLSLFTHKVVAYCKRMYTIQTSISQWWSRCHTNVARHTLSIPPPPSPYTFTSSTSWHIGTQPGFAGDRGDLTPSAPVNTLHSVRMFDICDWLSQSWNIRNSSTLKLPNLEHAT